MFFVWSRMAQGNSENMVNTVYAVYDDCETAFHVARAVCRDAVMLGIEIACGPLQTLPMELQAYWVDVGPESMRANGVCLCEGFIGPMDATGKRIIGYCRSAHDAYHRSQR